MARKTIPIDTLIDRVNLTLVMTPDDGKLGRAQLQSFLESLLMETGNYSGFRYLDGKDMEDSDGTSVGIHCGDHLSHDEMFADTDSTRVHYF